MRKPTGSQRESIAREEHCQRWQAALRKGAIAMPCRRRVLSMPAFYSGARAARLEAYFGTRGDRLRRPNQ